MIFMSKPWSSKLWILECWILMPSNSFYSFHFHISPFSPLLSSLFILVLILHFPYFLISLLYLFISLLLCSFQTCQNSKLFWNLKPHEPPSMEGLGFFVLLKIAKTLSLCTKSFSHTKNYSCLSCRYPHPHETFHWFQCQFTLKLRVKLENALKLVHLLVSHNVFFLLLIGHMMFISPCVFYKCELNTLFFKIFYKYFYWIHIIVLNIYIEDYQLMISLMIIYKHLYKFLSCISRLGFVFWPKFFQVCDIKIDIFFKKRKVSQIYNKMYISPKFPNFLLKCFYNKYWSNT
jgi:hypothetical protein